MTTPWSDKPKQSWRGEDTRPFQLELCLPTAWGQLNFCSSQKLLANNSPQPHGCFFPKGACQRAASSAPILRIPPLEVSVVYESCDHDVS